MQRFFFTACLLIGIPCQAFGQAATESFTIPFDTLKTQHMVIEAKVNGVGPFRFVFDTGAPDSIVSNRVAKKANVFSKDFKKPAFTLFGSQGQVKIQSLEVGGLKAEKLSAMVIDHPLVEAMGKEVGGLEGIIGFTFFARYDMTVDYQKKTMTFRPTGFQPKNAMENMAKMLLERPLGKGKRGVVSSAVLIGLAVEKKLWDDKPGVAVTEVFAGTPAAKAGMKKGDRLLTLDGRWTETVEDCHDAASQFRPGESVEAEILRDEKKQAITITPVRGG